MQSRNLENLLRARWRDLGNSLYSPRHGDYDDNDIKAKFDNTQQFHWELGKWLWFDYTNKGYIHKQGVSCTHLSVILRFKKKDNLISARSVSTLANDWVKMKKIEKIDKYSYFAEEIIKLSNMNG